MYSFTYISALARLPDCATDLLIVLGRMLSLPVEELLPFTDDIVNCLPVILSSSVPRKVTDLVNRIWFKIHSLTPRRYVMLTRLFCPSFSKRGYIALHMSVGRSVGRQTLSDQ